MTLEELECFGARIIPVGPRSKIPIRKDWGNYPETANWFKKNSDYNVGVVLGTASKGLVDIDLDDPIAGTLAPLFLPETDMIFGRRSNPSSHYIYRVTDDPGRSERFQAANSGMLVEYRSDGSQTVFPPSVHESGEKIEFVCFGEPATISRLALLAQVEKLAAATLLSRHWIKGSRHELALAFSGALLRTGWKAEAVEHFLAAICDASGDAEKSDRLRTVTDTVDALDRGENVSGWPTLATRLGQETARGIATWLHAEFSEDTPEAAVSTNFDLIEKSALYTDLGNAKRFCQQHTGQCFYHTNLGRWFVWDGSRWLPSIDGIIEKMAHQTALSIFGEVAKSQGGTEAIQWARQSCSSPRTVAMLQMAQPYLGRSAAGLDGSPYLLNCLNGTVDLKTGEMRPHRKADMITQLATVRYDPEATAPRFTKFVDEIFDGDSELVRFVQRALGYCLSGETKEQVMFVFHGSGANGKGTLVELVASVLGDYAKTAQADTLMQKAKPASGEASPDIARLVNARLVTLSEGDRKHRFNEALVKQLTGEDTVTVRTLYKEPFEFKPPFKLVFSTNYLPNITGSDQGIWRRLLPVPFNVTFDEERRDRNLKTILDSEKQGVLKWLVEGCLEWQRLGLNPPKPVLDAKAVYRTVSDNVLRFLEERTERSANATIGKSELYQAYQTWCSLNGERYVPNKEFVEVIVKQHSVEAGRTSKGYHWIGLELITTQQVSLSPSYAEPTTSSLPW